MPNKIVVGLGNPGDKYKQTRHNIGFMALDKIAAREGLDFRLDKKFKAEVAQCGDIIYVKPMTYMNNSGQAVEAVMSYYKMLPKKMGFLKEKDSDLSEVLTVIHDEIDIEQGKLKTSVNSRHGGHNGIRSIINHLKTKNFTRIRVGIKNELREKIPAAKFVLMRFSKEEIGEIGAVLDNLYA